MVLGLFLGREEINLGLDGLLPIMMPAQELVKRPNQRLGNHSTKRCARRPARPASTRGFLPRSRRPTLVIDDKAGSDPSAK